MATPLEQAGIPLPESLDEILFDMAEPYRTWALEEVLAENADPLADDDQVLIRSNDGKPYKFMNAGKLTTIPPSGRKVPIKYAIRLLMKHGRKGQWRDRHQGTGMTRNRYENAPAEERARAERQNIFFNNNYLVHAPRKQADPVVGAEDASTEE